MFQLVLDEFQGPLDLLLILIQKKKLDITEISISKIADDFLNEMDRIKENSLEVVSDFIFVATKILEIKSRYMLNINNIDEDEEYSLVESLEEYAKYKSMAQRFMKIYETNILSYEKVPEEIIVNEELNLVDYTISNIKNYVKKEEVVEQFPIVINQNKKTIEEKIDYIEVYLKKHSKCIFDDILQNQDKPERVVSLLGVLQMARDDAIEFKQNYNFSPIILEKGIY